MKKSESVYTVAELARRWKCDRHTITTAIRAGRLHAFRPGGQHYRISEDEVLRYEQQQEQKSKARVA